MYQIWLPDEGRVIRARDVRFHENTPIDQLRDANGNEYEAELVDPEIFDGGRVITRDLLIIEPSQAPRIAEIEIVTDIVKKPRVVNRMTPPLSPRYELPDPSIENNNNDNIQARQASLSTQRPAVRLSVPSTPVHVSTETVAQSMSYIPIKPVPKARHRQRYITAREQEQLLARPIPLPPDYPEGREQANWARMVALPPDDDVEMTDVDGTEVEDIIMVDAPIPVLEQSLSMPGTYVNTPQLSRIQVRGWSHYKPATTPNTRGTFVGEPMAPNPQRITQVPSLPERTDRQTRAGPAGDQRLMRHFGRKNANLTIQ